MMVSTRLLEKQEIQDSVSSTRQYNELLHQSLDNNTQYVDLKHDISKQHERSYDKSVYQETFIRNKRSDDKIGEYKIVRVFQDDNSLFWAFAIAYLFPASNNRVVFICRCKQLFGDHEETVRLIEESTKIFNPNKINTVLRSEEFQYLINSVLRNRFVAHIKHYKTKIATEFEWQKYLQDGTWNNNYALRALSMMYNVSVCIMQRRIGSTTTISLTEAPQSSITLLYDHDHYDVLINTIVYEHLVSELTEDLQKVNIADDSEVQHANVQVQKQEELIAKDMIRFDVQANSYCLFHSVVLAYLIPVHMIYDEYIKRFKELFGAEHIQWEREFWRHIQRYYLDQYNIASSDQDMTNIHILIRALIIKVLNYITSQPTEFITADRNLEALNIYLDHFVANRQWADDTIVKALSALLKISITVYNKDGFKQTTHAHNGNVEITLSCTLLPGDYKNYYRFYLNNQYISDQVLNPSRNSKLHELLSSSELDSIGKDDLVKRIKEISGDKIINELNVRHETPLMHYIITHQHRINPEIIRVLISDFQADVNTPDARERIPLFMLLEEDFATTNPTLLSFVIQRTRYENMLKRTIPSKLSVIGQIISAPDTLDLSTLTTLLHQISDTETLKLDQGDEVYKTLYADFINLLANMQDVSGIDYMIEHFISPESLEDEQILSTAIHNRNYPLITRLLKYGLDIVPLCSEQEENCMQIIKNDPVIKKVFTHEFANFEKQIILFKMLINIPNPQLPIHDITDGTNAHYMLSLVKTFRNMMQQFHSNYPTITTKENLEHFLELASLVSDYSVEELDKAWQYITDNVPEYKPFDDASRLDNLFARDPINNAILGQKTNFIKFWLKHQQVSKISSIKINKLGMTVVHAIAQSYLSDETLKEIITIMGLTSDDILSSHDLLGRDSLYYAIIAGNTAFVKFWIDIKGKLNNIDKFQNTIWHTLAMSEVHKIENEPDDFDHIDDLNIRDKLKKLQPGLEGYNEIYYLLKNHINSLPVLERPNINGLNNDGNNLIHTAILCDNSVLINLISVDFGLIIDWNQVNNKGQNVAHIIMEQFLEDEIFYDPHSFDVVRSVLQYDWEQNIRHRDQNRLTPIEMFTDAMVVTPYAYLTVEIEETIMSMQQRIITPHDPLSFQKYNQQVHQISSEELTQHDKDLIITIKFLLFFLVFDTPNADGDHFIHLLIKQHSTDVVKKHMLYFLQQDEELMNKALLQVNNLGQYPIYTSIVDGDIDTFSTLINYYNKHDILSLIQTIGQINIESFLPLLTEEQKVELKQLKRVSLLDYIIICKQQQMLKPLLEAVDTTLDTRFYPKVISIYQSLDANLGTKALGLIQDSHLPMIPEVYITALLQPRNAPKFDTELVSNYGLFEDQFKILQENIPPSQFSQFCAKVQVVDLLKVRRICRKIYQNPQTHIGKTPLILCHSGHAVAIMIISDTDNKFHVYHQNSQPLTTASQNNHIFTLFIQELHIGMENIHQLNVYQQGTNQLNCVLWSISNLYFMDKVLQQHQVQPTRAIKQSMQLWIQHQKTIRIVHNPQIFNTMITVLSDKDKINAYLHHLEHLVDCIYGIRRKRSIESLACNILKKKLTHEEYIDKAKNSNVLLSHAVLEHLTQILEAIGIQFDLSPYTTLVRKVDMKQVLYSQYIYLYLIKNNQNAQLEKWLNTVKYRAELINTVRSIREDRIVTTHSKHINDLFQEYSEWDIFREIQYPRLDDVKRSGLLFHNGIQSILISYDPDKDHYRLYSPDLRHNNFIYTKSNLAFSQLERFVRDFFLCFSSSSLYTAFTLSEQLPKNFIQSLKVEDFLNNKAWMPDYILVHTQESYIDGIPLDKIVEFFTIDGQSLKISDLSNLDFFKNNKESLKYKIQNLHKTIVSLDDVQVSALISIIKNYGVSVDSTYIDTLSAQDKIIFLKYSNKVDQLIKSSETITLQQLSELSWQVLEEHLSKHHEFSEPRAHHIIQESKNILYHLAKKRFSWTLNTQFLFFLPDIVRSVNTNDFSNLKNSAALMLGDITIDKALKLLTAKLSNIMPAANIEILQRLPANGVLFQILTIYTIYDLNKQLHSMNPDSQEYKIIQLSLVDQYVTLSLILCGILGFEVTTFWVAQALGSLFSATDTLNQKYQLHISMWSGVLMGLGFQQSRLAQLVEEGDLVQTNLLLAAHTNQSVVIIKVPKIVQEVEYHNITKNQIPDIILAELFRKKDQLSRTDYDSNELTVNASGYRLVAHYIFYTLENGLTNKVINTIYYQRAYYNALPVDDVLCFDAHSGYEAKLNTYAKNNEIFINTISAANKTWVRNPSLYSPLVGTSPALVSDIVGKQYPIKRDTGNIAFYSQMNSNKHLDRKYLNILFDPREGSTNITFTKKGTKLLDQFFIEQFNTPQHAIYVIKIHVLNKPYSNLLFSDTHSNFTLMDLSTQVHSQYIIHNDFNLTYNISDTTTDRTTITFMGTAASELQSYNTINVINNNMIIREIMLVDANNTTSISNIYLGIKNYLRLNFPLNHFIDQNITLQANALYITGLHGISNTSKLIINDNGTFNFNITGQIIIDNSHTQLAIVDSMQYDSQYSNYMHDCNTNEYSLRFINFIPSFNKMKHYTSLGMCHTELSGTNTLYHWRDPKCNSTLNIQLVMNRFFAITPTQYITISNAEKHIEIFLNQKVSSYQITQHNMHNVVINDFNIQSLPQDTYIYFTEQKVQLANLTNTYISTLVEQVISDRSSNDDITVLRNALLYTHIMHGVIVHSEGGSMNDLINALDQMHYDIHTLDLSNNDLTQYMEKLLPVLLRIHDLRVLKLQKCNLDDRHLLSLLRALPNMHLNKLDLAYNSYYDHHDIAQLIQYQCPNASEITEIYISYNNFDRTALSLLSQLDCPYLKILDAKIEDSQESINLQPMINIHLQDNQNVSSILNKLSQCQDIPYEILLADYKLQDIEILSLIRLLNTKQFCNIRMLDLSNNAVVLDQKYNLIQVLPTIHGLEVLKLISCHINNIQMGNLLDMLPMMHLQVLDVSNNQINNAGINQISIRTCPELSHSITINISGNRADKDYLKFLQEARNPGCDYIHIIDGTYINNSNAEITRTARHTKSSHIEEPLYVSSTDGNTSTYGHNIYDTTIMLHHKHRHHHGENHELSTKYNLGQKHITYHNREPRDIEDEFARTEDIDKVVGSQDDIHDSNVRLISTVHPNINMSTFELERNQLISNKVSTDINSEDQSSTDNSADILECDNDISSAGDILKPIGYNMIKKLWGYLNVFQWTQKTKDTSGNISNKLSQNILNDHIEPITDQYTTHIPNSLKIGYDNSNNSAIQEVTNTFDTHGNLILAQLFTHKLFGNNKLLNTIHYISPEQEYNVHLNNISQEILPILSEHYLTNDYNSHYNTSPQWYQDLFQDNYEAIVSNASLG